MEPAKLFFALEGNLRALSKIGNFYVISMFGWCHMKIKSRDDVGKRIDGYADDGENLII